MEKQNKIQWIYSSRNNKELTERYDQWAKGRRTYTENFIRW